MVERKKMHLVLIDYENGTKCVYKLWSVTIGVRPKGHPSFMRGEDLRGLTNYKPPRLSLPVQLAWAWWCFWVGLGPIRWVSCIDHAIDYSHTLAFFIHSQFYFVFNFTDLSPFHSKFRQIPFVLFSKIQLIFVQYQRRTAKNMLLNFGTSINKYV